MLPLTIDRATALSLILAAVVAVFGYRLGKGDAPVIERVEYRPAVIQSDGSVIAERVPDAKPKPPPHEIPRGHVEVRRVEVEVQPDAPGCPVCRVDLSLVRDTEGGQRVIASSPNGTVTRALDVPILPGLLPPPVRPWAAGLSYDPFGGRGGVWIARDVSRIRIGADLQQSADGDIRALVRVGWRFGG